MEVAPRVEELGGVVDPTTIKAEVDAALTKTEAEVGVVKAERRRKKSRNALVSASLCPAAWFLFVFSFAKLCSDEGSKEYELGNGSSPIVDGATFKSPSRKTGFLLSSL